MINVATGGRISLNELLKTMNRIVGSDIQATYGPPRAGDVRDSQADITKARTLLGYTPFVDLEEGLRHTLEWCRAESRRRRPPATEGVIFPLLITLCEPLRVAGHARVLASRSSSPHPEHLTSAGDLLRGLVTRAATTVVGADLPPATREGAVPGRRAAVRASRMVRTGSRHMKRRTHESIDSLAVRHCAAGRGPAAGTNSRAIRSRADAKAPAVIVNLNTATLDELQTLPGIGASTAARILEYRQKNGPFKKIEELMNVRGVGEKSFLKLRSQITVAGKPSRPVAAVNDVPVTRPRVRPGAGLPALRGAAGFSLVEFMLVTGIVATISAMAVATTTHALSGTGPPVRPDTWRGGFNALEPTRWHAGQASRCASALGGHHRLQRVPDGNHNGVSVVRHRGWSRCRSRCPPLTSSFFAGVIRYDGRACLSRW